ncbi:MAG: HIT domain-containing protein [Actinobacteria bacterium]|uniref:Unannotated protein n=1 Tax=freshwater metagenome TaxID=449393 RepID=A0A6J6PTU7_9ZZZZ|nr:HIT domain-containing protein [Actinomycetota bacterium]
MAEDCVFCAIVAGRIPSTKVAEDERTFAFMDINPGSEGHALVIPKEHAPDLLSIPAEDLAACALMGQRIAQRAVAADGLGADGVNLVNSCGAAAWQTVFHFHLHVIPRYAGQPGRDSLQLPWTPAPADVTTLPALADRLRP